MKVVLYYIAYILYFAHVRFFKRGETTWSVFSVLLWNIKALSLFTMLGFPNSYYDRVLRQATAIYVCSSLVFFFFVALETEKQVDSVLLKTKHAGKAPLEPVTLTYNLLFSRDPKQLNTFADRQ